MCHRQLESAKAGIGLQLRFAQGRLAVTALGSDEHLPSMAASPSRLQFCGLARNRVCFIEFSSIEKNASQIALRYSQKEGRVPPPGEPDARPHRIAPDKR